ncbi:MAG TPA: hypothetical protein VGP26_07770 [Actinophytocola sp.]|jgi:uncharacterized protein YukE|nr:hypothetical protein [Actinophytocola sp.]
MTTFQRPSAVAPIDNADLSIDGDEHSKDIIGAEPIDKAVEHTIPGYNDVLELKLATSAHDRHNRLGGLGFGRIEKDIARLHGLAAAVENISMVVRDGKERLAQDWKGDSYDAFRANIEKLETTLNDYKTGVETTAAGLETALSGIRSGYQAYRDHCLSDHFDWGELPGPDTWWRMSADSAEFLAENCNSVHGMWNCFYNEDEYLPLIDRKLTNDPLFNGTLVKWDCTQNDEVVRGQYNWAVETATEQRKAIQGKINAYCDEAESLRATVGEAYDRSLDNLRILAESNVFSHLAVPGATAPAGGDPGPGGGPGPGSGDPGPGAGPGPGDGGPGSGEAAMPPPQPNPAPEPQPAPEAAVEPAAATDPVQPAADGESVTIKDGDRSISVTSPDGEGHVKVTVETGDAKPKSYDLDFDAASGMAPRPDAAEAPAEPDAEKVPAGTNGQCVIRDGDLTITAERPLFDPGTLKLEVDDGVNEPTTYSLDFDDLAGNAPGDSADGSPEAAADHPAETPAAAHAEPAEAVPPAESDAADKDSAAAATTDGEKVQVTTPQADFEAQPDPAAGVLVPDQATGEAELASAGDDDPAGAAGAAAPMMGGAGAGGAGDGGRAGTGWSVHGDLFDNGDPVYSMHGILGEDDLEGR